MRGAPRLGGSLLREFPAWEHTGGEPTPIVSEFAARGCLRRAVNEYSCDHELRGDRGLLSTAVRRTAVAAPGITQGQAQALAADE